MKTFIIAVSATFIGTMSFADHYNHNHRYHNYDNPRFEQEADWVRNQHRYKRMHARDYHRQQHQHHQYNHQQNSNSDVSLMLGIILGAMVANSNQ